MPTCIGLASYGELQVLVTGGFLSESLFDRFMEMLQAGFVAAEKNLILGTRAKPALNTFGQREVLLFNGRHQQIHITIPMSPGALGLCRFRRVQRNVHHTLVGRITRWIDVPGLQMIALHDQNSVWKEYVNDGTVGNKIPL